MKRRPIPFLYEFEPKELEIDNYLHGSSEFQVAVREETKDLSEARKSVMTKEEKEEGTKDVNEVEMTAGADSRKDASEAELTEVERWHVAATRLD